MSHDELRHSGFNRRTALKSLGTSIGAIALPVGTASATSEHQRQVAAADDEFSGIHMTSENSADIGVDGELYVASDLACLRGYQVNGDTWSYEFVVQGYGAARDHEDDRRAVIDFHAASVENSSDQLAIRADEDDPKNGSYPSEAVNGDAANFLQNAFTFTVGVMSNYTGTVLGATTVADSFIDFISSTAFNNSKKEMGWNYDVTRHPDVVHQFRFTAVHYEPLQEFVVSDMVHNVYNQWRVRINEDNVTGVEAMSQEERERYGVVPVDQTDLKAMDAPKAVRRQDPDYVIKNPPVSIERVPENEIERNIEMGPGRKRRH